MHVSSLSPEARKGLSMLLAAAAVLLLSALYIFWPAPSPRASEPPPAPARERAARDPAPPPNNETVSAGAPRLSPPSSTAMRLTIPKLERVEDIKVTTAHGSEEGPLRYGAMHVLGTGYPWQRDANTYIAGHRLGYPDTPSDKLFWDLDELESGDKATLKDADGRLYTYEVFEKRVVGPSDVSIAAPVPGKDLLSLQTCTLPDYSERLVVRAELVSAPAAKDDAPTERQHDPADAFGASG